MQFVQMLFVIIFFIICLILIFFILIQSGKGGSLGILGGASNTPFGSSTMDIVEKITWWSIVLFFILAILLAILFAAPRKISFEKLEKETTPISEQNQPSTNQ